MFKVSLIIKVCSKEQKNSNFEHQARATRATSNRRFWKRRLLGGGMTQKNCCDVSDIHGEHETMQTLREVSKCEILIFPAASSTRASRVLKWCSDKFDVLVWSIFKRERLYFDSVSKFVSKFCQKCKDKSESL